MKPKKNENLLLLASRSFDRAAAWRGWGSIAFGILMLMVSVTANGIWDQRRLPRAGWLVALFVLACLGAFAWYRASANLASAHSAVCVERGKFGENVANFLRLFEVSMQRAEELLRKYACTVKEACDAERFLYERGVERGISPNILVEPERALEFARQKHEAQLTEAKSRVKSALAEFWEAHDLIQRFTHYELHASWKPYALPPDELQTLDEARREQKLGVFAEGANEQLPDTSPFERVGKGPHER